MSIYIPYYKPNKKFMQTSIAKLVDMIKVWSKTTEAGALLLLGKDRRILILTQNKSKNKAPTSIYKQFNVSHYSSDIAGQCFPE